MTDHIGLSIDGGGALGIGPAWLLALYGHRFDSYSGTSVGGILAAMLAFHDPKDAYALFAPRIAKIFHPVPLWWKVDPTRPKWQNDGLAACAKEIFGSLKMSDSPVPLFICASDFATGSVKVYDRSDSDLVADVVVRSASAPTYFEPLNSRWADGGIVANNPSMVHIAGLQSKEHIPFADQRILSLATGGTYWKDPKIGARMAALQWASPVIHFAMQASLQFAAFQAAEVLGDRYLRIDPSVNYDVAMDDLSSVESWRKLWQNLWVAKGQAIQQFVNPVQGACP